MRSINLLKLALDAEILRLRAMAERQARRAAFGSIALVFALAVLALAEVAGWQVLRLYFEAIATTVILLGINLIMAAGFGFLAARSSPGLAVRAGCTLRPSAAVRTEQPRSSLNCRSRGLRQAPGAQST